VRIHSHIFTNKKNIFPALAGDDLCGMMKSIRIREKSLRKYGKRDSNYGEDSYRSYRVIHFLVGSYVTR
jgi:hypothetical protein